MEAHQDAMESVAAAAPETVQMDAANAQPEAKTETEEGTGDTIMRYTSTVTKRDGTKAAERQTARRVNQEVQFLGSHYPFTENTVTIPYPKYRKHRLEAPAHLVHLANTVGLSIDGVIRHQGLAVEVVETRGPTQTLGVARTICELFNVTKAYNGYVIVASEKEAEEFVSYFVPHHKRRSTYVDVMEMRVASDHDDHDLRNYDPFQTYKIHACWTPGEPPSSVEVFWPERKPTEWTCRHVVLLG